MEKPFEKLTVRDNFMFLKVMRKHDNLKEFLKRMFPDRNIRKLNIAGEQSLQSLYGSHGVRLDIVATDEKDVYNVEMNATYPVTTLRRGRYYLSELDVASLSEGTDYAGLPDITTVFLIANDLFRDNICMHIGTVCFTPEGDPPDREGRTYVYLNISAEKMNVSTEMAEVLKYIKDGTTGGSKYLKQLDKDVKRVRQDPSERRAYMKLSELKRLEREAGRVEGFKEGKLDGIKEGKAEGLAEGKLEGIKEGRAEGIREGRTSANLHVVELLMAEGRSFEEVCSFLKLTEEEISELRRLTQSDKEQRI